VTKAISDETMKKVTSLMVLEEGEDEVVCLRGCEDELIWFFR